MSSISLALFCFLSHLIILTAQKNDFISLLNFTKFLGSDCFIENRNEYADTGAYKFNLNNLLYDKLASDPNIDYGFYNKSQGEAPNQVSAIGLCRGDIKSDDCRNCLHNATSLLLSECPNQMEAMGYNDGCMLRYSNQSIFGSYQEPDYYFSYYNEDNVTDPNFNRTVNDLLQNLTRKAAAGDSRRKFAASASDGVFQEPIYGLVQCTPDLSERSCKECLQKAILEINGVCCVNKKGARIVKLSCSVRYEKYPFYDKVFIDSLQPSPPPSAPRFSANTTSSTGRNSSSKSRIFITVLAVLAVAFVIVLSSICAYSRIKKPRKTFEIELEDNQDDITPIESMQFDFYTIRLATDNFSVENKLGQGGFGPVYKGRLSSGREIAVKRLSKESGQGDSEFKNEVLLVAKLQHRNLVKLLGFCIEKKERLLVYEFLPNKSLDCLLFDPNQRAHLDWEMRYKIIGGIARGLLYLHEDSRLRIIHRDLKTSNILLDDEMNPKISDFGMARLFSINQTQSNTSRIVGTYGYMAPEYAMHGQFSVKSDVFSFGVLILEIVSGKRNSTIFHQENAHDLLSFVWKNWREETTANIIDSLLTEGSRKEITRCIHIGLLCVQENIGDRPTMANVALMLSSHSLSLSLPSQPAFLMNYRNLPEMHSGESSSGVTRSSERDTTTSSVQAPENVASITSELHSR
ncbi:hypothetical protein K1719_001325 [Acacia pycnantha]|nr:hypothetical protein K1719_001325 [Acacia pycnantha]